MYVLVFYVFGIWYVCIGEEQNMDKANLRHLRELQIGYNNSQNNSSDRE